MKMNIDQYISVIENEKACVMRANECDRQCNKCELVMDDKKIIATYDFVLSKLKMIKEYQGMYK